jgi:hypothetical protein
MSRSCVTISWAVHPLSSSAIIRIVERRSWRMRPQTVDVCACSHRGGSSSTVSRPFTKSEILGHVTENHYQTLSVAPFPAWHTWLHNVARDYSSPLLRRS